MKKTYYYCLSLLLALCMAACGDDDGTTTPPDGGTTPEATIEGSTFAVLEGYEDAAQGFSTLKPAGLDDPIYIQDGTLAGSAYHFAAASASRLDELTTRPAADGNSWTALTDGHVKYIWHCAIGKEQLFDLDKDPGETQDLSSGPSYASTLEEMRSAMVRHLSERGPGWVQDGKLVVRKVKEVYGPNFPGHRNHE